MSLLGWTFRYKARNPRDKVYGIFGILKGLGATLLMQPRDDVSQRIRGRGGANNVSR